MQLPSSLNGPRLLRAKDLMEEGMSREDILAAVDAGLLIKPSLTSIDPEHNVYATKISETDYLHEMTDAMVGFLFGGDAIYHMQFAAMRWGLATSLPSKTQILLPASTRYKDREGLSITRTRRPAALTEGIEEHETSFGISFKITSKARTTIDLMRAKHRSDDDWRHGLDAASSYLDDNGDASELIRLSRLFEGWLPEVVETAIHSYSPGFAR